MSDIEIDWKAKAEEAQRERDAAIRLLCGPAPRRFVLVGWYDEFTPDLAVARDDEDQLDRARRAAGLPPEGGGA